MKTITGIRQVGALAFLVLANLVCHGFGVEREMKESGEKGGTQDINIGVGELTGLVLSGVEDIGPVSSYEFELTFDPSVLEFVRAEDLLFGGAAIDARTSASSLFLSASGDAPSSLGDFFHLSFEGLRLGESTVVVADEHVFDTESPPGEYLPVGANDVLVKVVPEPSALLLAALVLAGCSSGRSMRGRHRHFARAP